MIQEGKFGLQEAVCLTTMAISTKIFFTSPAFLTRYVGTTGWYMTLVSCGAALLVFGLICLLMKRFPGKNIVEIFDLSLGRFFGFLFSIVFALAFLYSTSIVLREFADVLKVFIFPATDLSLLVGGTVAVAVVSAFIGLESIARVAKLLGYTSLFAYVLLLLLASNHFKVFNLFPIMGYGLDQTLLHGLRRSSAYSEVLLLTVFAGSLQGTAYFKKAGIFSLVFSGLILSAGLLCFSMMYPYPSNQEITAPVYVLVREIRLGGFLQRLDPVFLLLWNFVSFVTVSILFYCSASGFCKAFRLQDMKPVVIPLGVLLFALAMTPRDMSSVIQGQVQMVREYGWAAFYGLPLVALLVAAVRKKGGAYGKGRN